MRPAGSCQRAAKSRPTIGGVLSALIRERLRHHAAERRRFGYRRLGLMLERENITMNEKKLYRLYKEEGLAVRRRRGRKRATGTRAPLLVPTRPNERWSLDFVSDTLRSGRRLRVLVVIDDATRECLAAVPDTSISGVRVARELDVIVALRGAPRAIVSDNGLHQDAWHPQQQQISLR